MMKLDASLRRVNATSCTTVLSSLSSASISVTMTGVLQFCYQFLELTADNPHSSLMAKGIHLTLLTNRTSSTGLLKVCLNYVNIHCTFKRYESDLSVSFVKVKVIWGIVTIIWEFPYYKIWAGFFKSILAARLMGWLPNNKIPTPSTESLHRYCKE